MSEGLKEAGAKPRLGTPLELAFQDWLEHTTPHPKTCYVSEKPFTYEFRRYGRAIAQLELKGDYLLISRLEALEPGQGAARGLIEFLKSLSDKYQVRLFARAVAYTPEPPVPIGRLLSQAELLDWYGRMGFQIWPINRESADIGYPDLPAA